MMIRTVAANEYRQQELQIFESNLFEKKVIAAAWYLNALDLACYAYYQTIQISSIYVLSYGH